MQIIIQRHGVPDTGKWGKINSKKMPKWIEIYNNSGVNIKYPACKKSIKYAKNSFLVCSTLQRSKHSAELLLKTKKIKCYQVFCEADLPVINIPLLKTTPHMWSMIFRIFWFLGISKNVESRKEITNRVNLACQKLEELAQKHTNIHLVGHGIMNRLIAKKLLKNGWDGEEAPNGKKYYGFSYWEYSKFTKS